MLNRNPNKRLGAGPSDAEEIKSHKWFKGFDWNEVYNRKLIPPKPFFDKRVKKEMINNNAKIIEGGNESKVKNWTFIKAHKK